MKFGYPSLFRHPIWITLESDKDVKFLIKPLSYADVYGSTEAYYLSSSQHIPQPISPFHLLESSILDFKGIAGTSSVHEALSMLSLKDKMFLDTKLKKLSTLSPEQLQNIDNLIYILLEPQLQDQSYDCKKCQSIPGMQQSRNCPLLDTKVKNKFKIKINNTIFTSCPIPELDVYISNQIVSANNFISMNTLPLEGGIGNQSVWFVEAAQRYKIVSNSINRD